MLLLYPGPGDHNCARRDRLDCVPRMCRAQSQTAARGKSFFIKIEGTHSITASVNVICLHLSLSVFL